MKTIIYAAAALTLISFRLPAQVPQTVASQGQAGQFTATPYQVVAADGNSCVWERTDAGVGTAPQKHRYIQLEGGMNHLVGGKWVPSSENIEVLPDGTGAATNGQHQAYFPGDIYAV